MLDTSLTQLDTSPSVIVELVESPKTRTRTATVKQFLSQLSRQHIPRRAALRQTTLIKADARPTRSENRVNARLYSEIRTSDLSLTKTSWCRLLRFAAAAGRISA